MKKRLFQIGALCLVVCATPLLGAQTIDFKVPFNFLISNKTFPAGRYFVSGFHDHLTLQDASGKPVFFGIVNSVSGRRAEKTGMIVFHCYDHRCFLSEYWTPTRDFGSQLLASRFEKELAKHNNKGVYFASLGEQEH